MADEDLSIAAPAVETPSGPVVEPVAAPEPQELPEDVLGTDSEEKDKPADGEEAEDEDELDFAFKKYKVPKSLKEGIEALRADYTKKTQSTAETAKALEQREAAIAQQAEASEVELDARATLKSVKSQLAEYAKLTPADWLAHSQTDPLGVQQHQLNMQALKDQQAELEGTVTKAQTDRTEKAQQDLAKRVQETLTFAEKEIPGFKPDTIETLVKFAGDVGVSEDLLKAHWSPTLLTLLHRAHIGTLALSKQPTALAKPAAAPIAPLTKVSASSSAPVSKSLAALADTDDMEAYAAARAAGRKR